MNCNYNSRKQNLSEANNFYQALTEKYQTVKSVQANSKQSRARCNSKAVGVKGNKKNENKDSKARQTRSILFVPGTWRREWVEEISENFHLHRVITNSNQLVEVILAAVQEERPKFISLSIEPTSQAKQSCQQITKSSTIQCFIQPLARLFEKATICIYSISNQNKSQFYDMLSIRRQIKTDSKLLVQTNICNNSKSGIVLRKLVGVAKEREKLMMEETALKVVVVKLKGVIPIDNHEGKETEVEVCAGGYGEIGNKDLMGAEKLRIYYNIIQVCQEQEYSQVEEHIGNLRRKQKAPKENELIEKIKHLQMELMQKRKELEEQKQRVANEEAIEAELEDVVLPSQRPMVNIDKYETRLKVGSAKSSFRVTKRQ